MKPLKHEKPRRSVQSPEMKNSTLSIASRAFKLKDSTELIRKGSKSHVPLKRVGRKEGRVHVSGTSVNISNRTKGKTREVPRRMKPKST